MIWSVGPVSAPLQAWNGEPRSTLIAPGAPVIAACFAGSVYIAKRLSGGAGRTTDWEMMVRMGGISSLATIRRQTAHKAMDKTIRCPPKDRPPVRILAPQHCLVGYREPARMVGIVGKDQNFPTALLQPRLRFGRAP